MSNTSAPTSPVHGEHVALGAQFTDFAGWQMPLKYDGELAEHHIVRTTAGLFDLSHMGEIAITGPDAAAVLDFALVGELSKIGVGRAKYSLLCNGDGGVVDDLVVYRLADAHFLVVANAANALAVSRELTARADGFAAIVEDRSRNTALFAVQGPSAEQIVRSLVAADQHRRVADLKYYAVTAITIANVDVLLARTGYTGEDGFEVYVPNDAARELWCALLDATTSHGGRPAGLACRDTLRLEAGMALYGHELTLGTNPYEAGLGKVVRLNKVFVGRDALQELADTVPRRALIGLVGVGRRAARAGYTVHDEYGDRSIGSITSGSLSPTLGHPIALAFIDTAFCSPGTSITVDIRGKKEPFSVSAVPFYRRP